MSKISVVIPLYNKARNIRATLESVRAQTFPAFEIIVINDGSTDQSVAIVQNMNLPNLRLISQENQGAAAARNTGIKAAKGDFVALLDADDFWYPSYLSEINALILKFPKETVFATAVEVEKKNKIFPSIYSIMDCEANQNYCLNYFSASLKASLLTSSSVVFRKNICEKIGYFNTDYASGQDTDFWIRIGLHFRVVFSSKILVRYNYIPNSLSHRSTTLNTKPNFDRYRSLEKDNLPLKHFLDNNRFSLALLAKLAGDQKGFRKLSGQIDIQNMNLKKRILLKMPASLLRLIKKIQFFLLRFNLYFSPFN